MQLKLHWHGWSPSVFSPFSENKRYFGAIYLAIYNWALRVSTGAKDDFDIVLQFQGISCVIDVQLKLPVTRNPHKVAMDLHIKCNCRISRWYLIDHDEIIQYILHESNQSKQD